MSAAMVPVTIDGWTLFNGGEGEHWVRDLDLAYKAELTDARTIRRVIVKAIEDGSIGRIGDPSNNQQRFREVKVFVMSGKGRQVEVTEYYLNEAAALLIVMRLRTPKAIELTKTVVRVFLAVARGEVVVVPAATVAAINEWTPEAIALKKAALLLQIANDMSPAVSAEAKDAMRANAAVFLTGGSITAMLPALPPGRWRRPTEIASDLGRTVAAVGRAITTMGFRDPSQANHCKVVLDKKKYGDGQVECFLWDDHVVDSLKSHFAAIAA